VRIRLSQQSPTGFVEAPKALAPMRFRFTIRDLLWLTLVVALAIGWRVNRNKLAEEVVNAGRKITEQKRTIAALNNVVKADELRIQTLAQPRFFQILPKARVIDTDMERAMMADPWEARKKMREHFGNGADQLVPDASR
jgi:hypothetical protein